ncbi:MAG: zinc ribbon domain-containing protein [Pirellulales bacterium]
MRLKLLSIHQAFGDLAMPLFEYHCEDCDQVVEILVMGTSTVIECPKCGGKQLKKQLSVIATPSVSGRSSEACEMPSQMCGRPQCASGGCMFGG